MCPGPSRQVQMRQYSAPHREQSGGEHDDADNYIDDLVEPFASHPLRQAEMSQLARQGRLQRECQRKQQAGAQTPRRRIATDRIAERDRPGMLVRCDAVHDAEQKRGQQVNRKADMRRVPQIDRADHAGRSPPVPVARQLRHRPRNTRWCSRMAAPVARSTAAKWPRSMTQGTGTSSWQRVQ